MKCHCLWSMRSEESKQNIILIRVIKMNSKVYKWCAVPQCKNTSIRTPNKVFVHVPKKKIIRDKWLKLARRNPNDVVTNSQLYFCEDHFDLPNDMENYMQYHVMGSVSQVRMKPGCIPYKFICQPDRKTRTSETTKRPYIAKKRRMMILEECEKEFEEKFIVTEQSSIEEIASGNLDDPDDPPERAPPPPADPTLALTCDYDPGVATQDQAVPTLPAPAEKDLENRCKDCTEVNEGFWFWCVECSCGALCGACAGRPPHHRHHVLRAPITADTTQTRAVLMVIRQQLLNENLLSQHETLDDGLEVEVKEELCSVKVEVKEEPAEPEPPQEPDPLTCEPHAAIQHQCIAEIVHHPQPLKLPQLPVAHAHKQKVILSIQRKLVKVSPTEVKRAFPSHLDRIVTTQQQVKGLQMTSQACKQNLVTQPSKVREYQGPKSTSQTAGNFTGITRPIRTRTQAPIKVTSEPQRSKTVILDVDETVEYLEEGLDSDIKTEVEVMLDDNEIDEDDNRVTN